MKRRLLSILLTACLLAGLLPTVAQAATNVQYLDASGNSQTASATEVTSGDTGWGTSGTTTWYVVNSNITIGSEETPQRVTVSGNVHLILTDGCTLTVNGGIQVQDNSTESTPNTNALTIYGQTQPILDAAGNVTNNVGKLIATGGRFDAGIGGGDGMNGGSVTINGGVVTADGGAGGAGIGGAGGTITISGGTVTANGGAGGAGIGGGAGDMGKGGAGGTITISGGTVTANGGGTGGAGIGGGSGTMGKGGDGGTITISGGTVTANGGNGGAGIGGGIGGAGGTVAISGGTVTISGGTVTAIGGYQGAGIGGAGGTVTISGGTVTADGDGGTGIGGSFRTQIGGEANGNAVIYTSSIEDNTSDRNNWSGIIFLNWSWEWTGPSCSGTVYGNPTLADYLTIPGGYTLTIREDASLTIPTNYALSIRSGATLINNGTLYSDGNTVIQERGTLTNNGAIYVGGDLSGTVSGSGALYYLLRLTDCKVDTDRPDTDATSTVNGKTYGKEGETIYLAATPSKNQLVKDWSVSGTIRAPTVDGNYYTISSMPANMVSVAAMFDTALNITQQPTGGAIDYGETTTLLVTVSPHISLSSARLSFQWYLDGSPIYGATSSSYTTPADLPAGEHTYTCTIHCSAPPKSYTVTSAPATVTVNQVASTLTAAPTEKTDLVYNGDAQALVNPGTASGGAMRYSLDGEHWSDTIPTGKDAGTYTVSYKVAGDANHKDSTPASVSVTIAPKSIAGAAVTLGTALTYNGSGQAQMVTKVTLDGVDITGSCDVSGNVQTNAGSHTLTVTAKSGSNYTGSVTQGFTISKKGITVDITPGGGTYGGTITPASADLSGVVDGDSVPVTLTYTGTANDGTAYNSTAAPTRAGSYTVTASISNSNYNLIGTEEAPITVLFTVNKATVSVPTIAGKTYTGSNLTADVPASERYNVTANEGGTDAGDYAVTLTLTDADNYRWDGSDEAAKTLTFTITKAVQDAPEAPTVRSKSWNSVTLKEISDNANGAKAQYSMDGGTTWQDSPIFTGLKSTTEYSFAARYAETDNYFASPVSEPVVVTTNNVPVSTYPPAVEQPDEGGSVTTSTKNPTAGSKVTITPEPDEGYEVGSVTVTDKNGNPVEVTDNGDGTYSFTQPADQVTIEVTFRGEALPFTDVPAGAYYYDAVRWAVKNGITEGTNADGTQFSPNALCTRAQVVTFLWRAARCPEPESLSSFADVSADSYYAKAVAWAVKNGITDGTNADGTTFSPDAVCSRSQIVTFLWRAQGRPDAGDSNPFTDVAEGTYYTGAVLWAAENGITNGAGDGTVFSPDDDCTRAQIVTFLFRCLGDE